MVRTLMWIMAESLWSGLETWSVRGRESEDVESAGTGEVAAWKIGREKVEWCRFQRGGNAYRDLVYLQEIVRQCLIKRYQMIETIPGRLKGVP